MGNKIYTYQQCQENILSNIAIENTQKKGFGIIGITGREYHYLFLKSFFRQENAVGCAQKFARDGCIVKGNNIRFESYIVYNKKGNLEYFENINLFKLRKRFF
ncbi:MAG: hypothetical protein ABFQ65_04375 [Nanoarchaeota archaeon]